jgi:hypothetical protein
MCAEPVGARVLMEKPVICNEEIDLQVLCQLPEDSSSFVYAGFMISHGCASLLLLLGLKEPVNPDAHLPHMPSSLPGSSRTGARSCASWTTRS